MTEQKKFPIGTQDFKELIESDSYYVDKTLFIKNVLRHDADVLLITRPRRFGKTLFMNTLARFFKMNEEEPGNLEAQRTLFSQTQIYADHDFCDRHMGQYPTVFISLKRGNSADFTDAYKQLAVGLTLECKNHRYLAESPRLDPVEKYYFRQLLDPAYLENPKHVTAVQNSLQILTMCLAKHHGRKVILLIDEYDVPLAKAVQGGYYDKMINVIRPLLENALKPDPVTDTVYLEKAVITGCLRVSKESIFTGLNNPGVNTVCTDDPSLNEAIGFTPAETQTLLRYYDLEDKADLIKKWYDGYRFGTSEIYCPWDLLNYCAEVRKKPELRPSTYWINSSNDNPIKEFLGFLSDEDTDKMQDLVDGKSVEITVNEHLNYNTMAEHKPADFWSLLLFTGYLTTDIDVPSPSTPDRRFVRIPNEEIRKAFTSTVLEFFSKHNGEYAQHGHSFIKALLSGDPDAVTEVLDPLLNGYVSIRDTATKAPAENFYHGFLSGLLTSAGSAAGTVRSNPEAGDGYADLIFTTGIGASKVGVVIEIKRCDHPDDIYEAADTAVEQTRQKRYTDYLKKVRCRREIIYGIAFCRKNCAVSGGAVSSVNQVGGFPVDVRLKPRSINWGDPNLIHTYNDKNGNLIMPTSWRDGDNDDDEDGLYE